MSYDQMVAIEVKPGHSEQFEEAFKALSAKVADTEKDTLAYRLYRLTDSETGYRVFESYASEDAAKHHMKNPDTRDEMRALGACMAGAPQFEILEER